jgi:alkylation response protein AidB-like acyl-CoA dehydrogenase
LAAACLAQRRVISGAVQYANERIQFNTAISIWCIRSKLAEMATSCYAGESASYRAAKDIEDRIIAREEGEFHQEAELKGLKNMLSNVPLKVVSEDVQIVLMKEFKFWRNGILRDTPMESAWRDARMLVSMKVPMKTRSVGMLIKKSNERSR